MGAFHIFKIVQMVLNRAKHHIFSLASLTDKDLVRLGNLTDSQTIPFIPVFPVNSLLLAIFLFSNSSILIWADTGRLFLGFIHFFYLLPVFLYLLIA